MERDTVDSDAADRMEVAARGLHPVDALMVVVAAGLAIWWFRLTDGAWFYVDEFPLALRGQSIGDLFQPYNGHLSITYIAFYRSFYGLFGFDHYEVLRAVGIVALLSVPASLYLTSRSRVGAGAAALVALLVANTTGTSLEPGAMNHNAALTFGIVAAWAFTRDEARFDAILAGTLLLSLATAGDALPFAVGFVVLCLGLRVSPRRWVAVVGPLVLWSIWRWAFGSTPPLLEKARLDLVDQLLLPFRAVFPTLRGLAFDSLVAAVVLAIAIAVALVRKVRSEGWAGVVSIGAWGVAWGAWWFGLAVSRGRLADPEVFRYRLAAAVLLALAVLPSRVIDGASWTVSWKPLRNRWIQTGLLALLSLSLMLANRTTTVAGAKALVDFGGTAQSTFQVAATDPPGLAPDHVHDLLLGFITQAQLLQAVRGYGPNPLSADQLDATLLADGAVEVSAVTAAPTDEACAPIPHSITTPGVPFQLRTTDRAATVGARLFGTEDVVLLELPAESVVTITPDVGRFDTEWTITTGPVCADD